MDEGLDKAREKAGIRGIGGYEQHIFLCIGPDCCTDEQGAEAWSKLKKQAARINGSGERGKLYRTKVGCLRICEQGPVAVVYPEGTWYGDLNPDNLNRVIAEHLGEGRVVEDLVIGRNPLPKAEGDALV